MLSVDIFGWMLNKYSLAPNLSVCIPHSRWWESLRTLLIFLPRTIYFNV